MSAPVITPVHQKLKDIRERKDLKLRPTKHLKDTFTDFDGKEKPLFIRYYQVQGILHLVAMPRFLLGDDTGLGKCKTLDSLVLTNEGLIRLGDLAPKGVDLQPDTFYDLDRPVKVWTGWEWAPVKRFYYNGIKPIRRIKTRRGYETTGSLIHPLWARGPEGECYVRMKDLSQGDFLALFRSKVDFPLQEPDLPVPNRSNFSHPTKFFDVPARLNPDLARLLGYIVSEGWTNSRLGFSLTQHDAQNPEVLQDMRALCKKVLGYDATVGAYGVRIDSVFLRDYLKGLGIEMGLSATKIVPWPILKGTEESVAAFLRGYFDGGGSVSDTVIEVSSASESLLKDVQTLLLRFGIMSSRSPKTVKGYEHTYWRLAICGMDARRFAQRIGFATPRKQEALRDLKSNPNLDVIPHAKQLVEDLRADILAASSRDGSNANRKGSGLKSLGVSFQNTLNNIRNYDRNPTYGFLCSLLNSATRVGVPETNPSVQRVLEITEQYFFYDPVTEIVEESAPVADLEIDDPRHAFVADGFVNHNTLETIAALCYLWEKEPNQKVIVLTTKSAAMQWMREFGKFTRGVKVILSRGSPRQREHAREMFNNSTGPTVLITGYRSAVQDFIHYQSLKGYVLVLDEATAFKNHKTQVHQVCRHLSSQASRVWGLTATLIKNNLMEGWGIYQVIVPGLFKPSYNAFMLYFAITRMQRIPRSNRQVPLVVGYYPEKIAEFRKIIDPFFIGRPKHLVASELPSLTSQMIEVDMSEEQEEKYAEALNGLLTMGNDTDPNSAVKEVTKLTAISYCQEIVNDLRLINCEGDSPKLNALVDLLTEGDLAGEKVIVFTRFEKMVGLIMDRLRAEKIPVVRLTGAEGEEARDLAKTQFQDPNGNVRVICITTAGSEAVNLQAAKAIICYDTPWSAGDFLQLLGRMIRIGSNHDRVFCIHLMSRGKRRKTIDHRVMDVLSSKMDLVEAVLGKRIKGEGEVNGVIDVENEISDLFASLKQDALEARNG